MATNRGPATLPTTLAQEVELLAPRLDEARGPIHLIGHSYGGAVAFKIATCSPYAHRVRSLTLIEPVLPTLLRDAPADRRLHDRFARIADDVCEDLFNGLAMEAIDKFTAFWNGSGPPAPLSDDARLRMIAQADKMPFDFNAILTEAECRGRSRHAARADAAGVGRLVALFDPAHRRPADDPHRRRRDAPSARRRPHAAADACRDHQSGDRRAYRAGR